MEIERQTSRVLVRNLQPTSAVYEYTTRNVLQLNNSTIQQTERRTFSVNYQEGFHGPIERRVNRNHRRTATTPYYSCSQCCPYPHPNERQCRRASVGYCSDQWHYFPDGCPYFDSPPGRYISMIEMEKYSTEDCFYNGFGPREPQYALTFTEDQLTPVNRLSECTTEMIPTKHESNKQLNDQIKRNSENYFQNDERLLLSQMSDETVAVTRPSEDSWTSPDIVSETTQTKDEFNDRIKRNSEPYFGNDERMCWTQMSRSKDDTVVVTRPLVCSRTSPDMVPEITSAMDNSEDQLNDQIKRNSEPYFQDDKCLLGQMSCSEDDAVAVTRPSEDSCTSPDMVPETTRTTTRTDISEDQLNDQMKRNSDDQMSIDDPFVPESRPSESSLTSPHIVPETTPIKDNDVPENQFSEQIKRNSERSNENTCLDEVSNEPSLPTSPQLLQKVISTRTTSEKRSKCYIDLPNPDESNVSTGMDESLDDGTCFSEPESMNASPTTEIMSRIKHEDDFNKYTELLRIKKERDLKMVNYYSGKDSSMSSKKQYLDTRPLKKRLSREFATLNHEEPKGDLMNEFVRFHSGLLNPDDDIMTTLNGRSSHNDQPILIDLCDDEDGSGLDVQESLVVEDCDQTPPVVEKPIPAAFYSSVVPGDALDMWGPYDNVVEEVVLTTN